MLVWIKKVIIQSWYILKKQRNIFCDQVKEFIVNRKQVVNTNCLVIFFVFSFVDGL